METTTIHPAESYLRNETNPSSLYVRIAGKRRRLFINRDRGIIGIIALGKRTKGYVFTDWSSIEQIYYPSQEQEANTDRKLILKYQKLARLATHTNAWLRDIANADLDKSLYENHITTGTRIDGKCIGLATIEKYCGTTAMRLFREALKTKRNFPLAALTLAVMTERFGVSHETMAICRQASARNIGIVATATTICLSTMNT